MKIRKATEDDLVWILNNGIQMLFFLEPERLADSVYIREFIKGVIDKGVIFLAVDQGKICGMLGGILHPNIYYHNEMDLTELFWWIPEKYRKSRAAIMLLNAFKEEGKRLKSTRVIISLLAQSDLKGAALEKRGYKFREACYVMEV